MSGALLDTNLLVYAYQTQTQEPRQAKARQVLADLMRSGRGFVSLQNLAEFSSVCLNKLLPPVAPAEIRTTVEDLEACLGVLRPSVRTVTEALRGVEQHHLSFWDAMIWSVAREHGLDEVLTEDFQDGQVVEGVRFRNPLR